LLAEKCGYEVVAECANGFEAVKAVNDLKPDLLFLDIQMPKLNGFEVLELIEDDVAVVFVTAYDEFAIKAFEVNAVDYLLKPFDPSRLDLALTRAHQRLGLKDRPSAAVLTAAAKPPGQHVERVLVRDGAQVHVVPTTKLDYVEACDDYVLLWSGGKSLKKQQPISELEATLDPARFVRIHRGYILNLDRLAKIELYAKDSRIAILKDGAKLPLSRAGYARLRELL
jgi:two-component system, LytTR family, response regulator